MTLFPRRQSEPSRQSTLTPRRLSPSPRPRPAVALVAERREHRRHDIEHQAIPVLRWDATGPVSTLLGRLVDISTGGVRIRTTDSNIRPDVQIRVRLELPAYCGISPFVDTDGNQPAPKQEWIGWMAVCRVTPVGDGAFEIGGRLLEMDDMDRGMLGLYLSTQPMAA
jgi:hypothetical protein